MKKQLLKKEEFKCTVCLEHFATLKGLKIHYSKKHSTDSFGHYLNESNLEVTKDEFHVDVQMEDCDFRQTEDWRSHAQAHSLKSVNESQIDIVMEGKSEYDEIKSIFNPGELELAKLAMDHNLTQATLRDFVKLGRSLSPDGEFENIRAPSFIFKKLNSYYEEHLSGGVGHIINNKKIVSDHLRKPITFVFESPLAMIRSLICERRLSENEMLLSVNKTFDKAGQETWGQLNTSPWYRKIYEVYGADIEKMNLIPCPVIMYSDSTLVDKMMKRSVHPIILQIGIHSYTQRTMLIGKRIVGYLPQVKKGNVYDKKHLSNIRRQVFHECWKVVIEEIRHGFVLEEKLRGEGELRKFCLFPAYYIADHPERQMIGGLRQSSQSTRPCPNCLVTLKDLKNYGPFITGDKRSEAQMEDVRQSGSEEMLKEYSIHKDTPFGVRNFPLLDGGLYDALVPCLMHTFARITLYVLKNVFEAVEMYGVRPKGERPKKQTPGKRNLDGSKSKSSFSVSKKDDDDIGGWNLSSDELESDSSTESFTHQRQKIPTQSERMSEFEDRFSRIPYFISNGKRTLVFLNGVTTLANLTAREKKSILFQLKFVLGSNPTTFLPEDLTKRILLLISAWSFVCKLVWTESGTKEFGPGFRKEYTDAYKTFINLYMDVFTLDSQQIGAKILFHAAIHIPDYVEVFGNPKNWTSDSLETSHGPLSKQVFQRTQKQRDATEQVLKVHRRYRAIVDIMGKEEAYNLNLNSTHKRQLPILEEESKHYNDENLKGKASGKKVSLPNIVPGHRFKSLLANFFEKRGFSKLNWNGLKYFPTNRAFIPGFGRLVAIEEFGKQKSEKFPSVFINPGTDNDYTVNELREWDIHQLSAQLIDEKLFLGQIYTFLEVTGTGEKLIDGKLCAVFAHFSLVHPSKVYNDLIEEPHIVYSTDVNNKTLNGRNLWWDIAFVDEIVRTVHIIPDFADATGRRAFIDTYPILH